ncbi:MAG TPA: 30S ribosomal protein S9 [Chthoniobacteraceae bacterium]|jgi:small subunit ribosomal protein S9|nr:ribosomal protein [Chthoniobacter sp.]HEV7867947.1 30S ribosomal protein S9 [Chthoniobacteraceae bacterium]
MTQEFIATGRRKNAVARIRMSPGTGKIEVNGRPFEDYFKTTNLQNIVLTPFEVAKAINQFDLSVNAHGGGQNGQAGAVRLAVARALTEANPELRAVLKPEGLLMRDPRMKERKKAGQPGARKRFQFSKR